MDLSKNQFIVILVGASGTGKSTVKDRLKSLYHITPIITHTTRLPRPNEHNGHDYYFETPDSFAKLHLIEHTVYGNHSYGSSLESIKRAFKKSNTVSIILDNVGTESYCNLFHYHCVVAYFKPMNYHILYDRIRNHSQSSRSNILMRLNRDTNHLSKSFISAHQVIQIKNDNSRAEAARIFNYLNKIRSMHK